MANVKKRSISLTPDLDSVVQRWIASGRYASRSEVNRAALRALEREEEERTGKAAAFTVEIARRTAEAKSTPVRMTRLGDVTRIRKKLGFAD
jgi:putative addiction module CopG family antidote